MLKQSTFAGFAAIVLVTLPQAASAQDRVDRRQDRQEERIDRGIEQGQITTREAQRLNRQQNHINRFEDRSIADGQGLNARERVRLERKQDRASANIARQRRDRQRPNR
ncbi:MAG: hypothetical protein WBA51_06680 [Erythrobacter sp.]